MSEGIKSFEQLRAEYRALDESRRQQALDAAKESGRISLDRAGIDARREAGRQNLERLIRSEARDVQKHLAAASIRGDVILHHFTSESKGPGRFTSFKIKTRTIEKVGGWILTQHYRPGKGGADKGGPWQNPGGYTGLALAETGRIYDYAFSGDTLPEGATVHASPAQGTNIVNILEIDDDGKPYPATEGESAYLHSVRPALAALDVRAQDS